VAAAVGAWLSPAGLSLVTAGIDPRNRIADVPLQLEGERYRRMDAHFARIGPHGALMMRQTASIQICLDAGPAPLDRWRLLNALAPYLVAMFANSPLYAARDTGHRSIRRHVWDSLDPARTGLAYDARAPVAEYARFALRAAAILLGDDGQPARPFEEHARRGVTVDAWREHLTTLFPEVRPRGYFEVRSTDALPPEWYVVPLAFLTGLTRDREISRRAAEIAGPPDASRLARAGRCGLSDPEIAAAAAELAQLAVAGCARLTPAVISAGDMAIVENFFDRYTRRRRSPADDARESSAG
jgi:glutamate--cysteine ligase